MNEALLSIEDLRVTFGTGDAQTEVLHGLNLRVGRGEAVGLVGESGSGKSVASLAVLGLLGHAGRVSGGRILLDGEDLTRVPEARMRALRGRRVSMIFQDPATALNPAFTIGAQLTDVIRAHRPLRGRAIQDEVHAVLSRVGFKDPGSTARAYPHELSGGMKQRAMIAAAVVCEPALLKKLVGEMELGLVFITHNLDLMAELCTRAVVLKQGELVEEGKVDDIFLRPSHEYTRHLIASIPRLPVRRGLGRNDRETLRDAG
jgi:ABC-type dipeptide/oligopeptide/nickel transport system ATPase component